ncbi:MAG: hypothetical protein N3C60_09275 [Calditerrivibrio sp.]|nr:hypothetical protein [Calditerrivibrio sp.]
MKKSILTLAFGLLLSFNAMASDLDDFILNLNMQVKDDTTSFKAELSTTFGADKTKVETVVKSVDKPADAYMVFRLAEVTKKQPEEVLVVYKKHKNKGWGAVAQELGIKPGSKEFHELKENKLKKKEHGKKEKHKEKDRDKGKGKDKE